jgi:sugar lactone lactonase YvrE
VKRLAVFLLIVAAVSAAAALWWRHWVHNRAPALDPAWTATVAVLAGDGVDGTRDGDRETARFSDPFGVAAAADGAIYVADAGDAQRIRRIDGNGTVSPFAGAGVRGFADGSASAATFNSPSGLAIGANGVLYVADTGNNAIRRITADGTVTTLAGDGLAGYQDGAGAAARFNGPIGVAADTSGRLFVADTYNDCIRAIAPDGTVTTLAGAGVPGFVDGVGAAARFDTPSGVAVNAKGIVYVADTGNDAIRAVDQSGAVTTIAWQGEPLSRPVGIAAGAGGDVYVADGQGRIFAIDDSGMIRTLAGSSPGFQDGRAAEARFRAPSGLAIVEAGRLAVADTGNALVRIAAAPVRHLLLPPASSRVQPRFDPDAFAATSLLWPVDPMDAPHEVAGTLGEARGTEGAERFHAGIDVRESEGTTVVAVRAAAVSQPIAAHDFGSLNESMRIGPVAYVHIRAGRGLRGDIIDAGRFVPTYDENGKLTRVRVKRGATFAVGQPIGSVNAFNHVHLNVGWPGEEYNPLLFNLVGFEDTVPPTIARNGVQLVDDAGAVFKRRVRGRFVIWGRVHVIVDAWDQANGNTPNRRLGLYELGYQVLDRAGRPLPGYESVVRTLCFDRLSIDPNAATIAYAPGSGIPFYRGRRTRFLYAVTNTLRGGVGAPGAWDTSALAPGDYILRVYASDARGNVATANRDVPVTVSTAPLQ